MNTALIVIYVLAFINLLWVANQHGKPRDDWNFWAYFISLLIELTLIWWALGWELW